MAIAETAPDTDHRITDQINPALVRFVELLDESITIPGTSRKIGLDGIIGLIPVAGDAVTGLFATWMLKEAERLNVPRWVRYRMVMNYAIDMGVGAIPLVGDLFDFAFKANRKNLDLMRRHMRPGAAE